MDRQHDSRTNGARLNEEGLLAGDDKVTQKDSSDVAANSRIEGDLRRLEKRYRSLLTAIAQIIWTTNADGLIEEDVPTWRAYTGQSKADVRGWGWTDAIHPDDRDYAYYVWSQAIITGSQYEIEYRIRRYDGVYRTFSVRAVPVLETNRSIREWVGVCTDITERKRVEEEHKQLLVLEQEARTQAEATTKQLEAIFESMVDGLAVYDSEGQIIHTNTAFRKLLTLEAQTDYTMHPLQERVSQLATRDEQGTPIPPEQWPIARILRGETLTGVNALNIMLRTLDGRDILLNTSGAPMRDSRGELAGAVFIMRDVTEQRKLERRTHDALNALLMMAEALIRGPITATPVTKDTSDSHSVLSTASVVGKRLAELTRDILGCQFVGIVSLESETGIIYPLAMAGTSPDYALRVWTYVQDHRLGEIFDSLQISQLSAGEFIFRDVTRAELRNRPGQPIQVMLITPLCFDEQLIGLLGVEHSDPKHEYSSEELALTKAVGKLVALVLERERLLHEREQARASELALREANRRMDAFLSMASHELRTPLTGINGYLELAMSQLESFTYQEIAHIENLTSRLELLKQIIERAEHHGELMQRLVNELLDISRIQVDKLQIDVKRCDLAVIVREVVHDQRQMVPTRTIRLEMPDVEKVPVIADADRIGQVVTNYLTNAFKYSPANRLVEVRLEIEGQTARVSVRDEGPGLTAQQQERIWDRFYQAEGIEVQSASVGGLGLGLYICQTFIERHNGQVGVQSIPGAGSTFWFTLPLAPSQE